YTGYVFDLAGLPPYLNTNYDTFEQWTSIFRLKKEKETVGSIKIEGNNITQNEKTENNMDMPSVEVNNNTDKDELTKNVSDTPMNSSIFQKLLYFDIRLD